MHKNIVVADIEEDEGHNSITSISHRTATSDEEAIRQLLSDYTTFSRRLGIS